MSDTDFNTLSRETLLAIARFERDTRRQVADEIEERDEKAVRLFLTIRGYKPYVVAEDNP